MAPPTPRSRSSPPCVLRFANQRSAPVRVVWCDYEGKEVSVARMRAIARAPWGAPARPPGAPTEHAPVLQVPYGIVQPHCSFNQGMWPES